VIVIDASALTKYILREDGYEDVRGFMLDQPYSLSLVLVEVSNAIWKHHMLYNLISREEAEVMFKALDLLSRDVLIIEPIINYVEYAVEIAMDEDITVYDSLYIAQAKKRGCMILTSDKKQLQVAERIGVKSRYVK